MKMIKKGTPKSKIYRFECKNCGCIFELDYNDHFDRPAMDLGPFVNGIVVSTYCPCCLEVTYGYRKEEEDADS